MMRENQLWAFGYLMIGLVSMWLGWECWRGQGFDVATSSDIELRRSAATELIPVTSSDPMFQVPLPEHFPPDGTNDLGPVETPRTPMPHDTFIFSGPANALAFPANSEEDVTTPSLRFSDTIPNGTYVAFKPSTDGKTIDVRTTDDSSLRVVLLQP